MTTTNTLTENIASLIDHTLLTPTATITDITALCREAREHSFHAVCVNPYWVPTAKKLLTGSEVKIATVVDFPLGTGLSKMKQTAAAAAVDAGADELDVVMNTAAALEGHWDFVQHETHEIVSAAKGRLVKIIIEICQLNDDQIAEASRRVKNGGAQFVKTSTGFAKSGATSHAVSIIRKAVGCEFGVKASGGIRDRAAAESLLAAGASRLGTSASVAILKG
jgi:deoxyribose-phosphate aldolase